MQRSVIRVLDFVSLHPGYDHNQSFNPSTKFFLLQPIHYRAIDELFRVAARFGIREHKNKDRSELVIQ